MTEPSHSAFLDTMLERREQFGMHLGLERIQDLLAELGHPQRRFRSVHIVGTNGKTSTTRFVQAIVQAHGVPAAAYVSPHVLGFNERMQVGGAYLDPEELASTISRVDAAAQRVEGRRGEPVTQFEVLTATAFTLFARAGVEVAAVEAGLGGRYDATNVIDARVVLLTSVGLDHMEHLGRTLYAIAAEKLAVAHAGSRVVIGIPDEDADPAVRGELERLALAGGAEAVESLDASALSLTDVPELEARGEFQRRNLALALRGAELVLGDRFDRPTALRAASETTTPGRFETISERPLTIVDGAHNPHGARALARELRAMRGTRSPLVGVIAILADKDVDGVLAELAPSLDVVVATETSSARSLPAAALADRCRAAGLEAEAREDPFSAVARARELAGPGGAVVVAGSLTLLADTLEELRARSTLSDLRRPG